jgi:hypothetical protein
VHAKDASSPQTRGVILPLQRGPTSLP